MVQYLIRLDDFCPTNNLDKWIRFFNLFDCYDIKPIIAVIPNNKDRQLLRCGSFNHQFWQLVRDLQENKYSIALHGYEHLYQSINSGMVKQNKRSEFAGLTLYRQERKILAAVSIFNRENIKTNIFVAPAHSFDKNTLRALKKYSEINIISDGVLRSPYKRLDFKWIPVRLCETCLKKSKTWTFNYHPETCSDEAFDKLKDFIHKYHKNFVSASDLSFKQYTFFDFIYENCYIYIRLLRSLINSIKPSK